MGASTMKTAWIWRNGEFVRWEDATLHVMSHVVHYGSSVFEGVRCYATDRGPAFFRLRDHMGRLLDSARVYRMPVAFGMDELCEASRELLRRNRMAEGYLRPLVLRGFGELGVNPEHSPIDVYLMAWPWGRYLGADALDEGVDAGISTWFRPGANTVPTLAKAGGTYLNSQLMKMEAVRHGYAEAIAVSPEGVVSEGSGQNVFLVRDGMVITPFLDGTSLSGITRDAVMAIARDLGYAVREQHVPRERLYTADELFFSGTASEVTPIRSVDRITVGSGARGPVTGAIQARFMDTVRGKVEERLGWLTFA